MSYGTETHLCRHRINIFECPECSRQFIEVQGPGTTLQQLTVLREDVFRGFRLKSSKDQTDPETERICSELADVIAVIVEARRVVQMQGDLFSDQSKGKRLNHCLSFITFRVLAQRCVNTVSLPMNDNELYSKVIHPLYLKTITA